MNVLLFSLKAQIESLRKELHSLILYKNLTDDSVVNCSQKLDKLITKYQHYRKQLN